MVLDGENSIYQFAKVNIKVSKSKIILLLPGWINLLLPKSSIDNKL
jgi:hypothetical protein